MSEVCGKRVSVAANNTYLCMVVNLSVDIDWISKTDPIAALWMSGGFPALKEKG